MKSNFVAEHEFKKVAPNRVSTVFIHNGEEVPFFFLYRHIYDTALGAHETSDLLASCLTEDAAHAAYRLLTGQCERELKLARGTS